jgi:hypothetical protein
VIALSAWQWIDPAMLPLLQRELGYALELNAQELVGMAMQADQLDQLRALAAADETAKQQIDEQVTKLLN